MDNGKPIPWRRFITKPVEIEAVEIGTDITIPDLPAGDFLIRNPDPIEAMGGNMLHCPREQFMEHYTEVN